MTADRLLKSTEAAEFLCIEPSTLARWRWSGCGPVFHKIGSAVRYRQADLEGFIEKGRRQSTTEGPSR